MILRQWVTLGWLVAENESDEMLGAGCTKLIKNDPIDSVDEGRDRQKTQRPTGVRSTPP